MIEPNEISTAEAAKLEASNILAVIEPLLTVKSSHTICADGNVSLLWKNNTGEIGISVKGNGYAAWFAEDALTCDIGYNSDEPIDDMLGSNSDLIKFINEHDVCKG